MTNTIEIQFYDTSSWRTVSRGVPNLPSYVIAALREAKKAYPQYRVRAVDENGRVVDMLM